MHHLEANHHTEPTRSRTRNHKENHHTYKDQVDQ